MSSSEHVLGVRPSSKCSNKQANIFWAIDYRGAADARERFHNTQKMFFYTNTWNMFEHQGDVRTPVLRRSPGAHYI